jgi:hypothetical protein
MGASGILADAHARTRTRMRTHLPSLPRVLDVRLSFRPDARPWASGSDSQRSYLAGASAADRMSQAVSHSVFTGLIWNSSRSRLAMSGRWPAP